jgi:hypothetical protein
METLGKSVLIQLMLAMSFIALAILLYMAQESQISVQQINISALRAEHMQLVADNTAARTRASGLQLTQRIDTTATRLGMSTANPLWVEVPVPRLSPVRPVNADTVAAQRQSAPLAWMTRFVHTVRSSL